MKIMIRPFQTLLLGCCLLAVGCQGTPEAIQSEGPVAFWRLTVVIEPIDRSGVIYLALWDEASRKSFVSRDGYYRSGSMTTDGESETVFEFDDVPSGVYAVSMFVDTNQNSAMDRNALGLPVEPYGFSGNPALLLGPPPFDRASFRLDENRTITITPRG